MLCTPQFATYIYGGCEHPHSNFMKREVLGPYAVATDPSKSSLASSPKEIKQLLEVAFNTYVKRTGYPTSENIKRTERNSNGNAQRKTP